MFALILLMVLGCVPKKDYEALQADLTAAMKTHEEYAAQQASRVGMLETDFSACRGDLKRTTAACDADRARMEGELEGLREDKATLVKDRSKLTASIAEMEDALSEMAARRAKAEERVKAYRDLLARFQKLIDAGRLRVRIIDGRMVVQMATDILFASGSAALSEEGRQAITEVAAVLAEIPDRQYQVEGHTDNVPIHTDRFPSNWELASARAITVVHALVEGGVADERVSAASYSEYRPATTNRTPEGKAENRRIEIVVLPDLSQLPGFEELQAVADE